jgi:hypothetical protein
MKNINNFRILKRGSGVRSGQLNSPIASHYEWTALADYVDRSIMWTIEGGMFRTPCAAWLYDD